MRLPVTHRLRHARIFFKTTAVVVIVAFLGLYLQPLAVAAHLPKHKSNTPVTKEPTDEEKLANTLEKIEKKLERLEAKLAKAQDASVEKSDLKKLHKQLIALDRKAMANFHKIEQHLKDKKLPQVILDRHYEAIGTYKAELKTLRNNLDAVETATTDDQRRTNAYKAKEHLKSKRKKRRHTPLDPNNLPFRVPKGKVRKPAESKEEFQRLSLVPPKSVQLASNALTTGMLVAQAAPPPGPDDLAPTEDVQITPDIQALADSLDNNPVKIFNWVHDNIFFMPTYGSIQGSQMTLETKGGNAFDTASLLIALLRASGIHARYVIGTVEIPIDKVMNWVGGVRVPEAALRVLGQGGIPSTGIVQGGKIVAVRLEHVWVEAFVDFVPSRGATHKTGDTWIPIDGSFKQYEFTDGIDINSLAPFDAQVFVNQIEASAQIDQAEGSATGFNRNLIDTTLRNHLDEVIARVNEMSPDATFEDVLGTQLVIGTNRTVLATSLPHRLLVRGSVSPSLPLTARHRFEYKLFASELDRSFDNSVLAIERSLPLLAGKRLTLSFSPATQGDTDLIASLGNALSFPGYLVRMKAELRIDGELISKGGNFQMGQDLLVSLGISDPTRGLRTVSNDVIAGEMQAIVVNTAGISRDQIARSFQRFESVLDMATQQPSSLIDREDMFGHTFEGTLLAYFGVMDGLTKSTLVGSDVLTYRLPSFGVFGMTLVVDDLFGLPRNVRGSGLSIDVDQNAHIVEAKDTSETASRAAIDALGAWGSVLEGVVPQILFSDPLDPVEGISTVQLLNLANDQGTKIFSIRKENVASTLSLLSIDEDAKVDIANAALAGQEVIVHQGNVTAGSWVGAGYIVTDPDTGSAAYRISGGKNGGFLDNFSDAVFLFFRAAAAGEIWADLSKADRLFGPLGRLFSFVIGMIQIANACAGDESVTRDLMMGYVAMNLAMIGIAILLALALGPWAIFIISTLMAIVGDLLLNFSLQLRGCEVVRLRQKNKEIRLVRSSAVPAT